MRELVFAKDATTLSLRMVYYIGTRSADYEHTAGEKSENKKILNAYTNPSGFLVLKDNVNTTNTTKWVMCGALKCISYSMWRQELSIAVCSHSLLRGTIMI